MLKVGQIDGEIEGIRFLNASGYNLRLGNVLIAQITTDDQFVSFKDSLHNIHAREKAIKTVAEQYRESLQTGTPMDMQLIATKFNELASGVPDIETALSLINCTEPYLADDFPDEPTSSKWNSVSGEKLQQLFLYPVKDVKNVEQVECRARFI